MSRKIIVIGATGMLGQPVTRKLVEDNFEVTVFSSNRTKAESVFGNSLPIVEGDVTKPETIKRALEGQDFVYINLSASLDAEKYKKIEIDGTANIAMAAKEAGVKKIANISTALSRGVLGNDIYLNAKVEAENAIIQSGVPYSIMRPSWFFNSLKYFYHEQLGYHVIGEQKTKIGWLSDKDFASQVAKSFQSNEADNKCFYNIGPQKMTIPEIVEKYCQLIKKEPPGYLTVDEAKKLAQKDGFGHYIRLIPFFEYISRSNEDVDPTESSKLLGENRITLENWYGDK